MGQARTWDDGQVAILERVLDTVRGFVDEAVAALGEPPLDGPRDPERFDPLVGRMARLRVELGRAKRDLRGKPATRDQKSLQRRATDTLRAWPHVERQFRDAVSGEVELLAQPVGQVFPGDSHGAVLTGAYIDIEQHITAVKQSAEAKDRGCHPFVSMLPVTFTHLLVTAARILRAVRPAGELSFLEVGAGAGAKLLIARQLFDRCDGLEYDQGYVDCGRMLFGDDNPRVRLFQGDATTFDRYGDYDVIYSFVPLRDYTQQKALEAEMVRQMKDGAVFAAPAGRSLDSQPDLHLVMPDVYVKGPLGEEAAALRARAAGIGLLPTPGAGSARDRHRDFGYRAGLLDPLAECLARFGFAWK